MLYGFAHKDKIIIIANILLVAFEPYNFHRGVSLLNQPFLAKRRERLLQLLLSRGVKNAD